MDKVDTKSVRFFRLINGMGILARTERHRTDNGSNVVASIVNSSNGWTLDRPLQCLTDIGPEGHSELLMFPYIPSTISEDKQVVLHDDRILFTVSVIDAVAKYVDRFATEYYDRDQTIAVTDVTKSKRGQTNKDVMDLLQGLENSKNGKRDDGGDDEGGSEPA